LANLFKRTAIVYGFYFNLAKPEEIIYPPAKLWLEFLFLDHFRNSALVNWEDIIPWVKGELEPPTSLEKWPQIESTGKFENCDWLNLESTVRWLAPASVG